MGSSMWNWLQLSHVRRVKSQKWTGASSNWAAAVSSSWRLIDYKVSEKMYHVLLSLLKKRKLSFSSCSRIEIKMKDQQMKQSFASSLVPLPFSWLCTWSKKGRAKGSSAFILPVKLMSSPCVSANLWKMLSTPVTWENCNVSSIFVVQ